jgi:multiple antibiotic resistance protein
MKEVWALFLGTFSTLLAIINPLEALPIFLGFMQGKGSAEHRRVAAKACLYAAVMMVFFMLFGTAVLKLFGVPLSMVRIVGGIILVRIGFNLFMPPAGAGSNAAFGGSDGGGGSDIAFVPLAMPLMFGPGALATVLGMSAMVKDPIHHLPSMAAIFAAILATMFVTYLLLAFAQPIVGRIGAKGIDAVTRIVGFFVSAMGMGLVFHGLLDALITYGVIQGKVP